MTMVYLGALNSRLNDFYDIWLLSREFDFEGVDLAAAIKNTFDHRNTELSAAPVAFIPAFTMAENTQKQWAAFVKRTNLNDAPETFDEIIEPLREFLLPVATALAVGESFSARWCAPGPWTDTLGR